VSDRPTDHVVMQELTNLTE